MNESPASAYNPIISTLNHIERVIEPKFFFLFGSFVFALDCYINLLIHKNLYSLDTGISFSKVDWGKSLVLLLTFSFLMAFAMKVMRKIIEEFIRNPAISISVWLNFFDRAAHRKKSDSERNPWEAMRIALDRSDKLLYEAAKEKSDLYWGQLLNQIANAQMAFSIFIFMLINRFVIGDESSPTLLQQLAVWSENREAIYEIFVYGFWSTVIFSWLANSFWIDHHSDWVYVPQAK